MKIYPGSIFLLAAFLLLLSACVAAGQSSDDGMLKPGDTVAGMLLTTGGRDAAPLWVVCSPAQLSGTTILASCSVPASASLAIGTLPLPANGGPEAIEWSALRWTLSLDDRPLDLEAFGTYRYVMAVSPGKPSQLREVFKEFTAWDVVLTNLTPGKHTLSGTAQTDTASTSWIIQLTVRGDRS